MAIFAAMKWEYGADLQAYNTFGLSARAERLGCFASVDDLRATLAEIDTGTEAWMVLGGGSNILLTSDFEGTMLRNGIQGIRVLEETDETALVQVGGGEVWHEFVLWTVRRGWGGVENLSLIPGSVGAAPIQNIGAYGAELKNSFISCKALEIATGDLQTFAREDCNFGYRWSIFKGPLKEKFIITSVTMCLQKHPEVNTSYGAIQQQLGAMGVTSSPTVKQISDAVMAIRRSKLPDPAEIGNSGSFFKNPIVDADKHRTLKADFPDLVSYPAGEDRYKIAAGWLIDFLGWKGHRRGDAGVHAHQALVLVNYGGAKGVEMVQLARDIRADVWEKFGIELEAEVSFIGPRGPM